ncbi:MAG: hypothetical protein C5B56_11775 [Proteobacteria bacterium]|nr:MAG: hypothetical protein C5B56_11775 [Pseudomonadota bacterium]
MNVHQTRNSTPATFLARGCSGSMILGSMILDSMIAARAMALPSYLAHEPSLAYEASAVTTAVAAGAALPRKWS